MNNRLPPAWSKHLKPGTAPKPRIPQANLPHGRDLHGVGYNFIKMHKTLKMTPTMAAGVSKTLWSMEDLCEKMDAVAPKPGKRGPYKKQAA